MAQDVTPDQKRRLRIAYVVMGITGAFAFATGLGFQPLGRYTIVYVLLGWAALTIPLHIFAVARSMRSSNRKAAEARARREERR